LLAGAIASKLKNDMSSPTPAPTADDRPPVVVGGGVAGLACALALADLGLQPLLIEKDTRFGGRAASWADPVTGDAVDTGPHVLLSEYRNMRAWLERLGTAQQVLWQRDRLITLLDRGRRVLMHTSHLPAPLHGLSNLPAALRCVGPLDLLSNYRVAWHAMRMNEADTLALDGMDALSWLRRQGVSEAFIGWFWASASMTLLNVPLPNCSAAALMRVFRQMAGHSSFHFGLPKVSLADLFTEPALRALVASGTLLRRGTAVRSLELRDGRLEALVLDDGSRLATRWCVLALPPQALREIAPPQWDGASSAPRQAMRFEGSPYVTTYLWFDRKLTSERFWARRWAPSDLNSDFYDLSNIRGGGDPDAPSLIACNAIHAHRAWNASDDQIVRTCVAEIADYAPLAARARLRHAAVHRIPMAIPCAWPGTETARPPTETDIDGLFLAGDWTRTGLPASMEGAVRSGWLAAEAVTARMRWPRSIARPVPETTGIAGLLRRRSRSTARSRPRAR
jgi:15-cis-phytoene desaturase